MIDRHSLPARMILSFIGVVILTAAATGIPAIIIFRGHLEEQAWSQVEQGRSAAQALYRARQNEIEAFASMAAGRPTLHALLEQANEAELGDYLKTLQENIHLNLILLCDTNQSPAAYAGELISPDLCLTRESKGFFIAPGGNSPQVWLVAAHPVTESQADLGQVIVGLRLDQSFVDQMHDLTGLDHTLLVDDRPVLTSLELDASGLEQTSITDENLTGRRNFPCFRFLSDCQPYYSARWSLDGNELSAEVALEVGDISATQQRLNWINTGTMFGVMAICSVLGIFLARRFSRPLVNLAESAERFSQGDLTSPVVVQADVREEIMVAQALERARVDLLRTLTALQREKAWVDHLLESIVEGIVALNEKQEITFFSHGAEQITGWKREQILHRACNEVFIPAEMKAPFSTLIPAPGHSAKIQVIIADQRQATLSMTGARFAPLESGDLQTAFVFRDVSEEESIHRLLGYFMANIAHEFRTPLSSLAASIELLLDQTASLSAKEMEELLRTLHLGILNLQTLVDNLLEGASIEAGHFQVSPRTYELQAIINEAVFTMQPLLEKYEQCMRVDLPAETVFVRADPRRTVQVLVNLLSNASRYGPSGAEITIDVMIEKDQVQVRVSDRGPGIPEEYRNEVFHRFLYTDLSSPKKVGAGLGLSVVKAVVEAQGGKVGVEDHPGGGSIFWFTLPVADES